MFHRRACGPRRRARFRFDLVRRELRANVIFERKGDRAVHVHDETTQVISGANQSAASSASNTIDHSTLPEAIAVA
jgi:hypothetical protein